MPYDNPFEDKPVLQKILYAPWVTDRARFRGEGEVWVLNPYTESPGSFGFLRAEALIGLKAGFGRKVKFKPEILRDEIIKSWPSGGTIIVQLGWWGKKPETSARVIIINMNEEGNQAMPDEKFTKKMKELFPSIGEKFRQNFVPLYFFRGGENVGVTNYTWKE